MFTVRKLYLLLLLLACSGLLKAQSKIINFKADLEIMKLQLQQRYPSLDRYNNAWNHIYDSVYVSFPFEASEQECYRTIKFLLSGIKDGHLSCKPSPNLAVYFDEKAKYFPVQLHFTGTKAYVWSTSINNLPFGTEITAIDGEPVHIIRENLFHYIVSDGDIETKKQHILNHVFYFYYLVGYGEKAHFNITFKTPGNKIQTMQLNAVAEKDIATGPPENNDESLKLQFNHNIAVLTIQTFDSAYLEAHQLDFESFIDSTFALLEKNNIQKLVIDLRGNGGGRDLYGSFLYSYLADKPFMYYKSLEAATDGLPYDRFTYPQTSYQNLAPGLLEKKGNNKYLLKAAAHPNLSEIKPHPNHYNGKVWVLVNGLTFSTAAEFCTIASANKRAIFIGEETGGANQGNTSGPVETIQLPHSGINVSYGMIQYNMFIPAGVSPHGGIIPDHTIRPTITEERNHKDVQLEFALKLAMKAK